MTADVLRLPLPNDASSPRATRPLSKLALSPLERAAVTGLVAGDADGLATHVQDRATAYASGDPDVRRRSLSRAAAVQEALVTQLSALAAREIARAGRAAPMLDKALTSATNRYLAIMAALRTEFAPTRRVMAVAKGTIAISAEDQS